MTDPRPVDGRRHPELLNEFLKRARVLLSRDGTELPVGTFARALFDAAARIGEEVTRRLDKVPDKQLANFLTEAGIGRDPASSASVPVAFMLAEASTEPILAPAGTRLMSSGEQPVIFETREDVNLIAGGIAAIRAVDAATDSVYRPADQFASAEARTAQVERVLRSGASAGAGKVQITPADSLAKGMILEFGGAAQHSVEVVEDDLVTLDPALESSLPDGVAVKVLETFEPFAEGTRNRQRHVLYLGHKKLFDIASALTISVTGLDLPATTRWHWWGVLAGSDIPGWHPLSPEYSMNVLELTKTQVGQMQETEVRGHPSIWLRATLEGPSGETIRAGDIRAAVARNDIGSKGEEACEANDLDKLPKVDYDAIAVTTPIVPNRGFHPFGREPRLFDTFNIGCAEAFSKAGAKVTLCFEFGGPELGEMVALEQEGTVLVFGVGSDFRVYRLLIKSDEHALEVLPRIADERIELGQTGLAAVRDDTRVRLAVPAPGGIYLATLPFQAYPLRVEDVGWKKFSIDDPDIASQRFTTAAFHRRDDGKVDLLGLVGNRLYAWDELGTTPRLFTEVPEGGPDPLPVDVGSLHTTQLGRVVLVSTRADELSVRPWKGKEQKTRWTGPSHMDAAVWGGEGDTFFFVARGDGNPPPPPHVLGVEFLDQGGLKVFMDETLDDGSGLPVMFSEPPERGKHPLLTFAESSPRQYLFREIPAAGAAVRQFRKHVLPVPDSIGFSGNRNRRMVHTENRLVTQRASLGLQYASSRDIKPYELLHADGTADHLVEGDADFVLFGAENSGNGYSVKRPNGGRFGELAEFPRPSGSRPSKKGAHILFAATAPADARPYPPDDGAAPDPRSIILPDVDQSVVSLWVALYRANDKPGGIWRLEPDRNIPGRWTSPINLPPHPLKFSVLSKLTDGPRLLEVLRLDGAGYPRENYLVAEEPSFATAVQSNGSYEFIPFPHDLIHEKEPVWLRQRRAAGWIGVGPSQSANPTLSWEYWNGRAWWALDNDSFHDATADLLLNGAIRFVVPSDLEPTDVGGKQNCWVRARLVGGEYGQAKVTVLTKEVPSGRDPKQVATEQEISRDLSTIRAPYVTSLRIGYCVDTFVLPEVVLTEDNLGDRDQTSANNEGQPVWVFTPVGEMMDGTSAKRAAKPAEDDDCRCEPCEPDNDEDPGRYPTGDCEDPGGSSAEDTGQGGRAIYIGLPRPPVGDRVTLYADVVPRGRPNKLKVEVADGGIFRELEAIDETHGLSEPGIITFQVTADDPSNVLDQPLYWLRLTPVDTATPWSPLLKSIHLNAARAISAETRRLTGLGSSSGIPDQVLELAHPPVEPASLDLRVRERPSEAELVALPSDSFDEAIEDMPGPWVRWREVDDLTKAGPEDRVFALNAETGAIQFGTGIHGMIPPLGAEILAKTYRHVTGAAANAIEAGAELQLVSPLAGVEKVTALDRSAGGQDLETTDAALKRHPAKIRHGGRIHTHADIEDFALAADRDIAQVRAWTHRGGVQLAVALRGDEPVPYPAKLRELQRKLAAASTYGISRPGGLALVAVRRVEIDIALDLTPDDPERGPSIVARARSLLKAFLDPATGGFEGRGWPIGKMPEPEDLAGALAELTDLALFGPIGIARSDGQQGRQLAQDQLVHVSDARISAVPHVGDREAAE